MFSGGEKMDNISTRITMRSIRKSKNLSLAEASKELNLSLGVLREIEIGSKSTTLSRAERISEFYGVPIEKLFIPKYFTAVTEDNDPKI